MRMLPFLLALALLGPRTASSGTVTVDPFARRVETSRLRVFFDSDDPEILRQVVFKDFDPQLDLSADEYSQFEFWGQSTRSVQSLGYIQPIYAIDASWTVTHEAPDAVDIRVVSESEDQPPVTTTYHFYADQPYFIVDRTVQFSLLPDSSAVQVYVPRVAFVSPYRAVRWRNSVGTLVQRVYCASSCTDSNWDGRWIQQIANKNTKYLSVASIFPAYAPQGMPLVRTAGPQGGSGAVAPLYSAQRRTTDLAVRVMIAFSISPDSLGVLDSLRTYLSGISTLDTEPSPAARSGLSLAAWPNPVRGAMALSWSLPAAGAARLALYDVSGRRVALLHEGAAGSGAHVTRWNGRDADGRVSPPGIYLARLETAAGVRSVRVVRVR